jgi:uncharacterized iron-regulated membrane protein
VAANPAKRSKRRADAVNARSKLRRRHAQIGAVGGALILFFAVSGLFWSGFWGEGAKKVAERFQGYPQYSEEASTSTPILTRDLAGGDLPVPWATERLPVPASNAGHHSQTNPSSREVDGHAKPQPIGIDQAVTIARTRLSPQQSLWINLPEGPKGVYIINSNGHGTQRYSTLHIDQYSGKCWPTTATTTSEWSSRPSRRESTFTRAPASKGGPTQPIPESTC